MLSSPQERKPTTQQAHKGTRDKGTRGREAERKKGSDKPTSPAKKGTPPPYEQGAGSPSPPQFFAPKNQQKVAWVVMKKFSEKFFGGMFRGKEKPLALSQRKGG